MEALKWFGTILGVAGALMVALKLPISGWGFVLFLLSSVAWSVAAYRMNERSLLFLQLTFSVINILGIYRWLFA